MNIQTLSAPTIQEAMAEARRRFGDDVLLVESTPPTGERPARVKVVADNAPAFTPPVQAGGGRYGYGALNRLRQAAVAAESPQPTAAFSGHEGAAHLAEPAPPTPFDAHLRQAEPQRPRMPEPQRRAPEPQRPQRNTPQTGRGQLFPSQPDLLAEAEAEVPSVSEDMQAMMAQMVRQMEAQFKLMHTRMDAMERRIGGSVFGASMAWAAHPLYAELVEKGMQPSTVIHLFNGLMERGFHPDGDPDPVRWAAAQEIRKLLDTGAPPKLQGTQLFIGPSGAGKTSLLLKLATHPSFFARRDTAVIFIAPDQEVVTPYQNPAELFRRHGLPFQVVRNETEMAMALDRAQHFDQILIDTPPMPMQEAAARKTLMRIKRMVHDVVPMQTHLVLNTTRALDLIDYSFVQRLPLRPDTLALTHLDETPAWGRVVEWIRALKRPILFTSTGQALPDSVEAFSAARFVEEMITA
ncbi:MAG: flagellar biosynthesis protein FlhF [Rhodothermales bacterium]